MDEMFSRTALLLGEQSAARRAAADREAARRAAEEKDTAERDNAKKWQLSEREKGIIAGFGGGGGTPCSVWAA